MEEEEEEKKGVVGGGASKTAKWNGGGGHGKREEEAKSFMKEFGQSELGGLAEHPHLLQPSNSALLPVLR